jgi:hypothetical protein
MKVLNAEGSAGGLVRSSSLITSLYKGSNDVLKQWFGGEREKKIRLKVVSRFYLNIPLLE